MNNTICLAIRNRNILSVSYDGHSRTIVPFCYGFNKNTRKELLRAYQIDGYSKSNAVPFWRTYNLSKISNIIVLPLFYYDIPDGYNPDGDSHITSIYCSL